LEGGRWPEDEEDGAIKPITTWSPSFKPSATSVLTPSEIPVRTLVGVSWGARLLPPVTT